MRIAVFLVAFFLLTSVVPSVAAPVFCSPSAGVSCISHPCQQHGNTTMDGDHQNIIACLSTLAGNADCSTGNCIWKAMTASLPVCSGAGSLHWTGTNWRCRGVEPSTALNFNNLALGQTVYNVIMPNDGYIGVFASCGGGLGRLRLRTEVNGISVSSLVVQDAADDASTAPTEIDTASSFAPFVAGDKVKIVVTASDGTGATNCSGSVILHQYILK